jgi:hypothetical protein
MMKRCSSTLTLSAGAGVISSGDSEVVVAHTVGSKPSAVLVTPSDGCEAPIEVPDADIGSSNFKVRFVGGVTLGVDAAFQWVAIK